MRKNYFFIILLFFIFLPLFLWRLETIPPNITGDESTYLGNVLQLLFSPKTISPLALLGDGSQPALNFYFMAFFVKLFGLSKMILAIRTSNVFWAMGVLVVFYLLLEKKTSSQISFFTTLLMGTSVWFLNFSRNGWFNLSAVFFGLLMIYFLEKRPKDQKSRDFLLAGLFAAIPCYGYFAGKIFPLAAFIWFVLKIILRRKDSLGEIKKFTIFLLALIITLAPLIFTAGQQRETFFRRPAATFVLAIKTPYHGYQKTSDILIYQTKETIKGLLFLEGSSIGKGTENLRYSPAKTSLVDPFIKFLFWVGIIFGILKRESLGLWWSIYLVTLTTAGILTVDTPNPARVIPILPFIYLLSGLGLCKLVKITRNHFPEKIILISIFSIVCLLSFWNFSTYWQWTQSQDVKNARQPAINYEEFTAWQTYQIEQIKKGQQPITNYEWYEIRNSHD